MKTLLVSVSKLSSITVSNATKYSDIQEVKWATAGFAALEIVSSAGSITITQQASADGQAFYDAVDQNGNALGAIVSAMTVGSKYVQFNPILARYIRYKVVESGVGSTVVKIRQVQAEGI